MVKTIVEDAHQLGISKIMLGKLKGIREDNHKGRKVYVDFGPSQP